MLLSRIADGLLAVLLAPACAACDASLSHPSRGPVCSTCWSTIGGFTPPLCGRCGDPLPSWRVLTVDSSLCPRCRRRPSALSGSRAIGAYDGSLRAIVHAFKYRRMPIAVTRSRIASARERCRSPGGRRHRRSGTAPSQPAPEARLQPGARARRAAGRADGRSLAPGPRDAVADRPSGRRTARQHAERLCARARTVCRRAADCSRGRREHVGCNDRIVCAGASSRGRRGCQRGDGSPSRVSTDRMTSAATSAFPRSPSRRTQSADAACRR